MCKILHNHLYLLLLSSTATTYIQAAVQQSMYLLTSHGFANWLRESASGTCTCLMALGGTYVHCTYTVHTYVPEFANTYVVHKHTCTCICTCMCVVYDGSSKYLWTYRKASRAPHKVFFLRPTVTVTCMLLLSFTIAVSPLLQSHSQCLAHVNQYRWAFN